MDIVFKKIGTVSSDGIIYDKEIADVTKNGRFHSAWKHAKNIELRARMLGADPETDLITQKIHLQYDNKRIYAVRLRNPIDNYIPAVKNSYNVKNDSILYDYQVESLQYICASLIKNRAACDGSDTGTGKTYVSLAASREMRMQPGIICKKGAIDSWKKACITFKLSPLFIINWEMARRANFRYLERSHIYGKKYVYHWKMPEKTMLIFDECHEANHETSQNYSMYTAAKGIYNISISATFADKPLNMKYLMYMLNIFGLSQYDDWLKGEGLFINRYDKLESISESEDMKKLNKIIFPAYGFRVSCEEEKVKKYFPDGIYLSHILSIDKRLIEKQNRLYNECIHKMQQYILKGNRAKAWTANLHYRQATEMFKVPSLKDLALEYIYERRSVIIFVNFIDTILHLSKSLKTNSVICGQPGRYGFPDREKIKQAFQDNKSNIIISTIQAGGESINLHDIKGGHPRISLICPCYDSLKIKQCLGRTRRANSKSTPIMKLVYTAGTIEEKVADNMTAKMKNISALNDGDLYEPDIFKLKEA